MVTVTRDYDAIEQGLALKRTSKAKENRGKGPPSKSDIKFKKCTRMLLSLPFYCLTSFNLFKNHTPLPSVDWGDLFRNNLSNALLLFR